MEDIALALICFGLLLPSVHCKWMYLFDIKCTIFHLGYCNSSDVRLYNSLGTTPGEGSVQYCYSETWYSACDYDWDCREANVVCKQLGYVKAGTIIIVKLFK